MSKAGHSAPAPKEGDDDYKISAYALDQITALSGVLTPADLQVKQEHVEQLIQSLAPSNKIEELLASQIIVSHETSMDCLKRANAIGIDDKIRQSELRMAAQYSKLFNDQLKTLYVYRNQTLQWEKASQEKDAQDTHLTITRIISDLPSTKDNETIKRLPEKDK